MENKYYKLMFWGYNPKDEATTKLLEGTVLVPTETMAAMTTTNIRPASFLKFIYDDGQEFYVARDCVHSLEEIYETD